MEHTCGVETCRAVDSISTDKRPLVDVVHEQTKCPEALVGPTYK